jgi:signal transduction histidine kinase
MGSLYWRVMALFWVALVAMIAASIGVTSLLIERDRAQAPPPPEWQHAVVDDVANEAMRQLDQHPLAQVQRWARLRSSGPLRVSIQPGRDVPAMPLPASNWQREREIIMTRHVRAADQAPYTVTVRWGPPPAPHPPPHRLLFRTVLVCAALLASMLVSLLLARYVALPLAQIRDRARRFADGDLDARVGTLRTGRSRELVALAREFDAMADHIGRLILDHRRLIGDVAHELRSPLARLRVALELGRGGSSEEIESAHDRIGREVERMNRLIAQALDLSRLESGTRGPVENGDLATLVDSLVADARFEATPRRIEIRLQHAGALPIRAELDLLASAIENVLRNAVRHAPEASVIGVELRREENGARARLRIHDRGPGVAEADLPRIFEPFFRTADARQQSSDGSGIGLAIARRAIARAGGRIAARNAEGGGLEVLIELPLHAS